jgi:hypothetical protein
MAKVGDSALSFFDTVANLVLMTASEAVTAWHIGLSKHDSVACVAARTPG